MDNDLAEAVKNLKDIFQKRYIAANFGKNDKAIVEGIGKALDVELPRRYSAFLQGADPLDVETATPTERVRFIPTADVVAEQAGYGSSDIDQSARPGWRPGWVVIAHSALLGDPYFLDTYRGDAEGDCPVMTAMNGTADLRPVLVASNFANFLRILAVAMDLADEFGDACSPDDEYIFRESLEPKIRGIDGAALREKHWTRG